VTGHARAIFLAVGLLLALPPVAVGQEIVIVYGLVDDALDPDALDPDVLDPDDPALEPDAAVLGPDTLGPDALGRKPVLIEELDLPSMHEDPVPLVFCHICYYWVDLRQPHQHRNMPRPPRRCSECHNRCPAPSIPPVARERPAGESADRVGIN
jgi:hypothetical protein